MWDADFPKGSNWKRTGREENPCRVMGVVEGYVIARFKGCAPFLRGCKEFVREFERVDVPKRPTINVREFVQSKETSNG